MVASMILKTQNKGWGFWGTASNYIKSKEEIELFWIKSAEIIQSKGLNPLQTLALMDSRWGRHIADEFAEELSTNLETFAKTFNRKMSKDRLIKEFKYFVDRNAFPDVKPRAYENFAKDLTKLCKTYGVTIKCIGGVSLHSQEEMKKLLGYSSDLDSGDILPIWRD